MFNTLRNKIMALQFINAYKKYIQSQLLKAEHIQVDIKYDVDAQISYSHHFNANRNFIKLIKISVILEYKVGCVYKLVQYTLFSRFNRSNSLNAPYSRINGWDWD